jgi:hypothetical protein
MDTDVDGTATSKPSIIRDPVKISTWYGSTLGIFHESGFVPFTAITRSAKENEGLLRVRSTILTHGYVATTVSVLP